MFNRLRRVRKMTYVLWAWCLLIVVWCIAGASNAAHSCSTSAYQSACQDGAGIGILIVLFIGFVGFCFFSLIWFMSRPREAR
jgi:hypothetical protein